MKNKEMTFTISPKFKVFFSILHFLLSLVILFALFEFINQGDIISIIVYVVPLIILVLLNIIHTLRSKIILTDNYIEKTFIRSKIIYFNNLKRINVYNSSLILKDDDTVIHVTGSFDNREMIVTYIISKIEKLPNLKIKGFQSAINKYFGAG